MACCWPAVQTMNASKHGQMHFMDGVEPQKICFKCVRRTQPELHTFMLLQYTSYSKPIEFQCRCCWPAVQKMNASKHGTNELHVWKRADKKFVSSAFIVHSLSYTPFCCTSAMAAIVNLLNINGNNAARLFKRWLPQSMVPINFLFEEELTKICLKCVCHTQPKLHTFLLLHYTSAMAVMKNLLNINEDAPGRMFEWWTPPSIVPMHLLDGEKLPKICFKYICPPQPELHTFLLLQL